MFRLILIMLLASLFVSINLKSQPNYWTWEKGGNTINQLGIYGSQGTSAPANNPGARYGAVTWTDHAGNFWLFGGVGFATNNSGFLNDLWKYDRSINEWTWMKGSNVAGIFYGVYGNLGIPSATNCPGSRYSKGGWVDPSGCLWLFGGRGYGEAGSVGLLNDLWKYNPATNEWSWESGSKAISQNGQYGTNGIPSTSNVPGARYPGDMWSDASGNLWLFGGEGNGESGFGMLNDLWKYNRVTNEWVWLTGSNQVNSPGVYGTIGVSSSSTTPPGRYGTASWLDANNNLYLFGGYANGARYNDLWSYNTTTNEWTWLHGSMYAYNSSVYGTQGIPAPANTPGSREGASYWRDLMGNFWLWGGYTQSLLNDLWKYNPSTNQWTWEGGTSSIGNYGMQNVSNSNNIPGSRRLGVSWSDQTGNLWMFGGGPEALDKNGAGGYLNDMWRYGGPSPVKFNITGGGSYCQQSNGLAIGIDASQQGVSYQLLVNNSPTGTAIDGTGAALNFGVQTTPGTYQVRATNGYSNNLMTGEIQINVLPPPTITISSNSPINEGQTINLYSTGGSSYLWSGPNGFTSTDQNPVILNASSIYSGNYTVIVTNENGCSNTATTNVLVNQSATGLNFSSNAHITIGNPPLLEYSASSKFTIETWINPGTMPSSQWCVLLDKSNWSEGTGILLFVNNGQLVLTLAGTVVFSTQLNFHVWSHIAIVYNNGDWKIFMNGSLIRNTSGTYINSSRPWTIGTEYVGSFDEFRIWNRALCQDEIVNNLNCELGPTNTDLAVYYKFNQGFINANNTNEGTVIDLSGNNINGTLHGFNLSGNTSNWSTGIVSGTCTPFSTANPIISANGATTFCEGETVILTSTPASIYQWQKNGVNINGATGQTYSVTASGNYSVIVSNGTGCSAMSNSLTVIVNPTPIVSANNNSPLNAGQTLNLTSSGGTMYSWTGPNGFVSTEQNPTITNISPLQEGIYTVLATDENGCSNTASTHVEVNTVLAGALKFDGNNDYVSLGNPAELNFGLNDYTIEATVKTNYLGGTAHDFIVAKAALGQNIQYALTYQAHLQGKAVFSIAGLDLLSNSSIADGQIHHLAVTRKGNVYSLFVDGVIQQSGSPAVPVSASSNNPVTIGSRSVGSSDPYFNGVIDEVRFWSRALCISEIQNNQSCELTLTLPQTALVGYYKFNQGTVYGNNTAISSLTDLSPSANNGQLMNFALAGSISNWCDGLVSGNCIVYTPTPVTITANGPVSFCDGGSVGLSSTALANSYQWKKDENIIPNATSQSYSVTSSGNYTLEINNDGCITISNPITVTIIEKPVTFNVTGGGSYCSGTAGVTITLSGSQVGVNYTLRRGTLAVTSLPGTGNPLVFSNVLTAGNYSIIASTDEGNCTSVMNGTVTVSVNSLPTQFNLQGGSYCVNGNGVELILNGSQSGYSYQLWNNDQPLGSPLTGTGSSLSFGYHTAPGSFYKVVATNPTTGCQRSSDASIVIIQPVTWFHDADGDGFGNPAVYTQSCEAPANYVENSLDCNDQSYNNPVWKNMGSPGFSPTTVSTTRLSHAYDNNNVPYIAYDSRVMKYDGTNWTTVGAFPIAAGAGAPQIHFSPDNTPYILYTAPATVSHVARLENGIWNVIGSFNTRSGLRSRLKFGTNGNLFIAYQEPGPSDPTPVRIELYSLGQWTDLGTIGSGNSVFLSVDPNSVPYAGYSINTSIPVRKYNGSSWVAGASSAGWGQGDLYHDRHANLFVCFGDWANGQRPSVKKFNGISWDYIASAGIGNTALSGQDMILDRNSNPFVVYNNAETVIPVGTSWQNYGGLWPSTSTQGESIAISNSGRISIAFKDLTNGSRLSVIERLPELRTPDLPVLNSSTNSTCGTSSVILNIVSGNLNDASQWVWYAGSCGGVSIGTGNSINVSPTQTTTYYVRGEGSCLSSPGECASITITINAAPQVYNVTGGGSYCQGSNGIAVGLDNSEVDCNYQLNLNGTNLGSPVAGTGAAISFGNQLSAGNYTVVATNTVTNCTATMNGSVTVTIHTLPSSAITASGPTTFCDGGSVTLTASAGASYLWNTGATTQSITVTSSGNYSVIVTDNNGCTSAPVCDDCTISNGNLIINPDFSLGNTGFTSGMNYVASGSINSLEYSIRNGTNNSPYNTLGHTTGATSDNFLIAAGQSLTSYPVIYRQQVPVQANTQYVWCFWTKNLSPGTFTPPAFALSINNVWVYPTIYTTTGTLYSHTEWRFVKVIWTSGNASVADLRIHYPFSSIPPDPNLRVMAIDDVSFKKCALLTTALTQAAISVTVNPKPNIYDLPATSLACSDVNTQITLSGSDLNVSYQLKKDNVNIGQALQGSGNPLNFGVHSTAGSYTITATNNFTNCSVQMNGSEIIHPAPQIQLTLNSGVLCHGGDASVTVSASGGTAPYIGTGTFDLPAGTFSFTITDMNGCSSTQSIIIEEPQDLELTVTPGNISCNGGSTSVNVSASGGTAPYTFTGPQHNVTAGTYTYTVTDANNCSKQTTITITEPPLLIATATAGTISCNGGTTTVTVIASGGTAPYNGTGTFIVAAGTHTYTVTDVNGCSASQTITISEPTALLATATAGSILCNGGTTTVTVTGSGGLAPYTGTGTFTVSAGNHSYIITDANGCTDNVQVTISEPDVVNLTLALTASNTIPVCAGTQVTFTASHTGGGSNPVFQWKKNGANVGTNSSAYTTSVQLHDVIECTIISSDACAVPQTKTSTITANVNPLAPAILISANPSGIICVGNTISFSSAITNGGSNPQYQWYKNNVAIPGAIASVYSTNNLVNGDQVSCQLTSNAACLATNGVMSNVYTASVIDPPYSVSIVSNVSNPVCPNSSLTFTAIPLNTGGQNVTFLWYKNGVGVNAGPTYTLGTNFVTGTTIHCVMRVSGECPQQVSRTSNIITIQVGNNANIGVSISADPGSTICPGMPVTFTANPQNGGPTPSYQWKKNGTNVGTNSATYNATGLVQGDVITCTMSSSTSCRPPVTSNAITININPALQVTPGLSITASTGTNAICPGTQVTFTANPSNAGSNPSYQWQKNGVSVGTNSSTYTVNIYYNDVISCIMTSNAPCASPVTATATKTLNVFNMMPLVTIVAQPSNQVCNGQTVLFGATVSNAGGNPVYQWRKNGVNITGANSSTYVSNDLHHDDIIQCFVSRTTGFCQGSMGASNIITIDESGCWRAQNQDNKGMVAKENKTIVDIQKEPAESIKAYPNPFNGTVLYMDIQNFSPGNYKFELIDEKGARVFYKDFIIGGSNSVQSIPLNNRHSKGIYLVRISNGNKQWMQKLVVVD